MLISLFLFSYHYFFFFLILCGRVSWLSVCYLIAH